MSDEKPTNQSAATQAPLHNDGGPAFPAHDYIVGDLQRDGFQKLGATRGMTLRDFFAAQVVAGCGNWPATDALGRPLQPAHVAGYAYAIADAMIAARGAK